MYVTPRREHTVVSFPLRVCSALANRLTPLFPPLLRGDVTRSLPPLVRGDVRGVCPRPSAQSRSLTSALMLLAFGLSTSAAFGQGAIRDLSEYSGVGTPFTVTITLDPPQDPEPGFAILEDAPPPGWTTIDNISNSGVYDAGNHKVKWGPFFGSGQIPDFVTYDITPPAVFGDHCFSGTATYDEGIWPITGDECILIDIPTVSEWGLVVMTLLVLSSGTLVCTQRKPTRARHTR